MDKIVVKGGPALHGEVKASGAKNAALPILASSLLADGKSTYRNVPDLVDVSTMLKVLRTMGCGAERLSETAKDVCEVTVGAGITPEAPYELVKTMRASVLVLGPLVARYGRARVSLPGGCAIGARPIDQHLKGLKALGADITLTEGYVEARAERLRGATVNFDLITVTGTENVMMAAVLAKGRTVLENCAREPEVEELARVLNKMGARIEGGGTSVITIDGVDALHPVEHAILPDRIEAGTLLVAAAISGGDVLVKHAVPEHMEAVVLKLREAGCTVTTENGGVRCKAPQTLRPVDVTTTEHPGFPTDMQAQLMVLLSVAQGTSVISEHIFENRFMHVAELHRMGADITIQGPTAVVKGVPKLSGAPVMATDLRASASLILAGLRAEGRTDVQRVYHLDRGYERLELKLRSLGADIQRMKA
ncbi:UDP-N-acetylglucosamine 1-carboxyvinyltransferase [Stigmatella aurantiaca]|uniref:UDP-N-acetylglucosamine 1-carboxyvinyltransferase n=1 Tax=Stigmatella aurantiaca (strain DW4/3-1) TaxID=378806 RepID=Q090K8_STIAD|nr:UDP-N-acetylglucosamine 1-carboxyvinyltransferase [Stigmatella aurantiaca]ADO73460.1 UDP-N-acetylglucosamine 1-carboxyvinyltransferase [Stigmatella aurantiaca DW4/3-1]EAU66160.1 UDP-N-acetylglucosamine 1-carboxyvinyltransferase [Stigmatella aurantiaca DW4/3-1]